MADQNLNPVGCLGRALTFLGIVWIGIVILGSTGILSELGMSEYFLGIGGSIIPAFLLLAAGRALRRRAKTMEGQPGPVAAPPQGRDPGKRVPTSRSEPTTTPPGPTTILTPPRLPSSELPAPKPQVKPAPKPVAPTRRDVTRSLEEVTPPLDDDLTGKTLQTPPMELKSPPPKTSQELVDEARKKWGGNRPR